MNRTTLGRFGSGEVVITLAHIAKCIREATAKIDVYVWIDSKTRSVRGYLFNEHRVRAVCDHLRIDRGEISRL